MKQLVPISLALGLIACGAKQQPPTEIPEPDPAITISTDGLDPAPDLPINEAALNDVYPGYEVDRSGSRYAVRWYDATMIIVDVAGDGTYRAKVRDPRVKGPNGIAVGGTFEDVFALGGIQCIRGMGQWTEQVYCTSDQQPGLTFAFKVAVEQTPGCDTAGCTLELLDPMQGRSIVSIDWQPSSQEPQ